MDFGTGEHKARWLALNRSVETEHKAITETAATTSEEVENQAYEERRHGAAVLFLRLPDEIVAEQRLKSNFGEWFAERAKYYVRMRQRREALLAASTSDVALQPFEMFYELLRDALFVPLVADVPELVAEHAELKRLEEVALARLGERASSDLRSHLLALKDRLLNIDASAEKLAGANPAYEEIYRMIVATARREVEIR
jgi:hypothetical protein